MSGWADGYSNAVLRLMTELAVPRRGPSDRGRTNTRISVNPAIGFLQGLVQWWDHWLKDADNGAMDEPMLRGRMVRAADFRVGQYHRP